MIYQTGNNGAQPSGKAAVFDTAILGSNPSAPAKSMNTLITKNNIFLKIKAKLFPFYKAKEIKDIFDILEKIKTDKHGEIQITDALKVQAKQGKVIGYKFKGKRFDCGSIKGYLEANNYLAIGL